MYIFSQIRADNRVAENRRASTDLPDVSASLQ
jgi:hypothetical protein